MKSVLKIEFDETEDGNMEVAVSGSSEVMDRLKDPIRGFINFITTRVHQISEEKDVIKLIEDLRKKIVQDDNCDCDNCKKRRILMNLVDVTNINKEDLN